jgi:hypothetical protein
LIHGGETKLENLILLCRRQLSHAHDEQFVIASPQPGKFVFLRPDGQQIPWRLRHLNHTARLRSAMPAPA